MKQRVVVIGALLLGFLAVGPAQADAAFKTFLLVPGISGSATEIHHVDWIEVLSMSQGAASTRKSVSCSDLSVMKNLDEAGPALWAAAAWDRSSRNSASTSSTAMGPWSTTSGSPT